MFTDTKLPAFNSDEGEALRDMLRAHPSAKHTSRVLDAAEADWRTDWLSWVDRTIIAQLWTDDDLVARWLQHEIEFGDSVRVRSLSVLLESYPKDKARSAIVHDALARYAYSKGQIDEGDLHLTDIQDLNPDYDTSWCLVRRLYGLAQENDGRVLAQADALASECNNNPRLLSALLPFYAGIGDAQSIVRLVQANGGADQLETEYGAYLFFSSLEMTGQLETAFEHAQTYLRKLPEHYSVYHILRVVAQKLDRLDEVTQFFELDPKLAQEPHAREIMILRALDNDDYEAAKDLFANFPDPNCEPALRARLTIATTIPRSKDVQAAYNAYRSSGVTHPGPEIQLVANLIGHARSPHDLQSLLTILEEQQELGRTNIFFQQMRLRLMIGLNKADEANALLEDLPDRMKQNWQIAEVGHYLALLEGENESVERAWQTHIAEADHRVLLSRSDNPTAVKVTSQPLPPGVVVFSCFYNALEYVDWFLNHYRALGVRNFVIVDNGSTDGTLDYLVEQPDVQTFTQPGSFKESGHGVAWINHLISVYAPDRWVLFVDMDECFVFPQMENGRTLDDLTRYADAHGYGAFSSFMLDMFAPIWSRQAGTFEAQTHFDNDYFTFPSVTPPYRNVQGGMRARLTGRNFLITKSPLVRTRPGFAFLENNHSHTHLPVADVGSALLHYKLVGDANSRIDDAIARREHYMAGRLYRDMQTALSGRGGIWPGLKTRRYKGPAQLMRLGLIRSTPEWDDWS